MLVKMLIIAVVVLLPVSRAEAVVCNILNHDVMIGSCSGTNTGYSNLNTACSKYPDTILVKCREKCVARGKNGVCKTCGWTETSSAVCTDTGDRMKLRKCDASQAEYAYRALNAAKTQIAAIISGVASVDKTNMVKSEKRKFDHARYMATQINNWLNRDRQFLCKGQDKGSCKGAYATAMPLTGGVVAIRLCDAFFGRNIEDSGATIIHEAAHSCCGATDATYYHGTQPGIADPWHTTADTYGYWARKGFCIPSEDGECVAP
ncbi:MAG: hypothetical protein A2234_05645 [Elusimicrobia bacterium RIFOXYA2_FULL_58_8]|nr:MAG: hypothetical protein A2285_02980 [Elusimicrobia bacterium RIFOXYA12_FULL_57_11]OGS13791.1 MAG: hypothetical protein A2234_05645 [Elusimicrobia bacterium RIFOXYA2_FULL_58_8]